MAQDKGTSDCAAMGEGSGVTSSLCWLVQLFPVLRESTHQRPHSKSPRASVSGTTWGHSSLPRTKDLLTRDHPLPK